MQINKDYFVLPYHGRNSSINNSSSNNYKQQLSTNEASNSQSRSRKEKKMCESIHEFTIGDKAKEYIRVAQNEENLAPN